MENINEYFEIEYKNDTSTLLIEVKEEGDNNTRLLHFNDNGDGMYKKNYAELIEETGNYFVELRFVFNAEKESMYRLFSLGSKNRPQLLKFNYVVFDFMYDTFSNSNYTIQEIKISLGSEVVNINPTNSSFSVDIALNSITPLGNEHYFDLKYSYPLKTEKNEIIIDNKVKRIYTSIDAIERKSTITLKHRYTLLNSHMIIKDQLLQRVTSQIYSCILLNERIVEEIKNNKIKYVLFFNKEDHNKYSILFDKYQEITCFSFEFKSLSSLGKTIDYFVKDKIDTIFIYQLEKLLYDKMSKDEDFDIQNYDYLYKENPIELQFYFE